MLDTYQTTPPGKLGMTELFLWFLLVAAVIAFGFTVDNIVGIALGVAVIFVSILWWRDRRR